MKARDQLVGQERSLPVASFPKLSKATLSLDFCDLSRTTRQERRGFDAVHVIPPIVLSAPTIVTEYLKVQYNTILVCTLLFLQLRPSSIIHH